MVNYNVFLFDRSSKVPKAIKTLKWKKNANKFQPNIHKFNSINVPMLLFVIFYISKNELTMCFFFSEWCSM